MNGVLVSGGFGISSNWVTCSAPCLLEVPTQSLPVSPPPITTTFLFLAEIKCSAMLLSISFFARGSTPATILFCCFRKCMAKCIPFNSLPGMVRSLGTVDPPAKTIALYSLSRSLRLMLIPTLALHLKVMPSFSITSIRLSITFFSSLKSGIP